MILVDANVLMYAAGAEHPNKAIAIRFLTRVASGEVHACLDAEVLQEILHRYLSLKRWPDGRKVFLLARELFTDVLPITAEVLDRARELVDADKTISARDAVHAAVVQLNGLEGICTFDQDFERIPHCARLGLHGDEPQA